MMPYLAPKALPPKELDFDSGPAWRWRFWTIFGGQTLSLVGAALTQFILLWWVTETTGSATQLAFAGLAALLPQALLSPLRGAFADFHCRRMQMIVANSISAVCMLMLISLFQSGYIELWHVYLLIAARSAMQAFQAPAAESSVAMMLVPACFQLRVTGLHQTLQRLALIVSAPLGALAFSTMPLSWALSIDVVTALLGVLPLLVWRIPQFFTAFEPSRFLWRKFIEDVQLVWHDPGLCRLYALLGAVTFVIMPTFTLMPLLVKEHFGGGATEVAWMEGLAGIGMMVGGIVVALLAPRQQIRWVLWGFAASCFTLALTALVPRYFFGVAVIWWCVSGITFTLANTPLTALLQTIIPSYQQGRALSLLNTIMRLSGPLGLVLAVPWGEQIEIRWLFVLAGLAGTVVSLVGFRFLSLFRLDRNISIY